MHDRAARRAPADDPFAVPQPSPRGARALALSAFVLALAAVWVPLLGVLGMGVGSVGHLKGERLGMVGAVTAGVTTIVGMTLTMLLRG